MKTKKSDFFVSIVAVIVVIALRPISFYHWVDGYPTELLEIDDETDSTYVPAWHIDDIIDKENENDVVQREEALENLQKIFGIRGHIENKPTTRNKIPPQFMMELYNTIADSSGVTRGKNPYNAKVVRSFIERDTLFSHLYLFNISGLEINESVLEAELHLYRKRASLKVIQPAILTSPYYLIRVYQVLEGKSMAEPDLHRLLNVHYVGAHASGWQVFNVKQAVLAWVSGAPNLGLMVTASNLFDDEVTVEFSRRNDYHNSKQPILVLFDDDGNRGTYSKSAKIVPHYYTYENEPEDLDSRSYDNRDSDNDDELNTTSEMNDSDDHLRRRKRHGESSLDSSESSNHSKPELNKEYSYGTQLGNEKLNNGEEDFFHREKKRIEAVERKNEQRSEKKSLVDDEEFFLGSSLNGEKSYRSSGEKNIRATRDENPHDFYRQRRAAIKRDRYEMRKIEAEKFVSEKRTREPQILISMDIYERAMLRERMTRKKKNVKGHAGKKAEMASSGLRDKRSLRVTTDTEEEKSVGHSSTRRNITECGRHELYVDFKEIGLSSSIIAPKGYSAYHCQGMCDTPLSQDQQPTNHATVQGIVHKMGLVADVHMPCCVPTKLVSTTILFFDDNENVVLKVYEDMIADRCGCR